MEKNGLKLVLVGGIIAAALLLGGARDAAGGVLLQVVIVTGAVSVVTAAAKGASAASGTLAAVTLLIIGTVAVKVHGSGTGSNVEMTSMLGKCAIVLSSTLSVLVLSAVTLVAAVPGIANAGKKSETVAAAGSKTAATAVIAAAASAAGVVTVVGTVAGVGDVAVVGGALEVTVVAITTGTVLLTRACVGVTTFKPQEANSHRNRMIRVFDQLLEESTKDGKRNRKVYFYTWTKPFETGNRPLDRHLALNITLDKRHFASIELCKNRGKNTIYPDSKFRNMDDAKVSSELRYAGSKALTDEIFNNAAEYFVDTSVECMSKFGGYDFLLNNCQNFVFQYLNQLHVEVSWTLLQVLRLIMDDADVSRLMHGLFIFLPFLICIPGVIIVTHPFILDEYPSFTFALLCIDLIVTLSFAPTCALTLARGILRGEIPALQAAFYFCAVIAIELCLLLCIAV